MVFELTLWLFCGFEAGSLALADVPFVTFEDELVTVDGTVLFFT